MTTSNVTSSTDSQMHNNIMAAVQAVKATDDSPAVPEHTTIETPMNMSSKNKAHFLAEKEAIHLILIGIRDDIYSTVDACQTAQEIWEAIERLQQGESLNIQDLEWSRFVTIVKQQHKLDEVSYHKLFDILKQYQKEANELCAEKLARNTNPLALVATAQADQDQYYQTSRSYRSQAPSSKPLIQTRSHTTTRHKGKEIDKPITPPSEIASKEDNDPEQAQSDKDMQKNFALIAKYFKKIYKPTNNNIRTSSNSKNKNGIWTFCEGMQKAKKGEGLHVSQGEDAAVRFLQLTQAPIQSQWNSNTCLVETDDSNVIPDSPDMCEEDIQNDQNDVKSDDERVALANLKLDTKQTEFEKYKAFNDHTIDYDKLERKLNEALGQLAQKDTVIREEIVDNAWIKHSKDQFRAPTAQDIEILIQTCLMPLAIKTQNDSFKFVHELKQEMHADLKYVESLEKEIDELEYDKAEFSDMYNVILQECVSNDVKCSYFQSLSDLDALAELQCMYLHKVKECDCLAQKLSKQIESFSKKVHTELLQRFAIVEKHSISLEIALQKCKEQVKNDTVCNEKASNVFQKEREQYYEIQDFKAKFQDKNIAISKLQKLIEKRKGKFVDTKFDRPSGVRQPNAQRIPKPSVLGKPTPISNSVERIYFQKTKSVPKSNVLEGLSKPVTIQTLPQMLGIKCSKAFPLLVMVFPLLVHFAIVSAKAIVSHLEFINVEIEQDGLNQMFLTSLALEWLMYTIIWRNIDDLDTMSLDDVYNLLKVYEQEVQKKSKSNSQNMAFISSSNTSSGKDKVHNASVPTASIQVSTASTDVAAASLSHGTVCAYIASQSNGSQIKYEDITQIDEDDIEEMDIK
nr:hypothetical protein [Tanacetum cinerariifolium]